jgi:Leucine-rich repeat (LRR) protein
MNAAAFGDLRALLQHPGPMRWRALCAMLDAWPDPHELDEVILPYCADQLRAWPAALRVAPARWLDLALTPAGPPPALTLCAQLTLVGPQLTEQRLRLLDLDLPHLTRLQLLNPQLNQRVLRALLASPLASRLTWLDLVDVRLNEPLWDMLLAWERLPQLTHLGLERCRITPAWEVREAAPAGGLVLLTRLLDTPLPALTSLNLRDNRLREEDFEAISVAPACQAVQRLMLGACPADPNHADRHAFYNRAGESGVRALITGAVASSLTALELSYNQLSDAALKPLLTSPPPQLQQLDLHLNHLKSPTGSALADSPLLKTLTALDVSGNPTGALVMPRLLAALPAGQIQELRVSRVKLGKGGARALAAATTLAGLTRLDIADNALTGAELGPLLAALHAPRLRTLNLGRNVDPCDAGVIDAILASPARHSLTTLILGVCPIAQVARLIEPTQLPHAELIRFNAVRDEHATPLPAGPRAWLLDRRHGYEGNHFVRLAGRMIEP